MQDPTDIAVEPVVPIELSIEELDEAGAAGWCLGTAGTFGCPSTFGSYGCLT